MQADCMEAACTAARHCLPRARMTRSQAVIASPAASATSDTTTFRATTVTTAIAASARLVEKYARDDLGNCEALVGRTLVEVRAMGLPERLAPRDAAAERERRIGKIVQRQE